MRINTTSKMSILVASTTLLMSVPLVASEQQSTESSEISTNPITGTVTRTKKYNKQVKRSDGKTGKVNVEEKTKFYKDGSVEKNTDTQTTTPPPAQ